MNWNSDILTRLFLLVRILLTALCRTLRYICNLYIIISDRGCCLYGCYIRS